MRSRPGCLCGLRSGTLTWKRLLSEKLIGSTRSYRIGPTGAALFSTFNYLRGIILAIAFLDIDDFKTFNTKYGETKIDLNLLPRFMQALEAHVYHHGHAYRQGGDEYL